MFSAALRLLPIKDLKDLRVFSSVGYYRHAGPKGPEEAFFHGCARGGQAPALRLKKRAVYRRARACPSPCLGWENSFGLRAFFAQVEQSRGTGPRATGQGGVLLAMRRSGAGAPELQSPAPIILLIVEIVIILLLSC